MQLCVSSWGPQATPPCAAAVVTVFDLLCVPPPHVALQTLHSPQSDNWQSTGHDESLQLCVSSSGPQATPPFAAAVVTVRDLLCVPPPHVALQAVHALQTDNWQSTGHGESLQLCVSSRAPQATPPFAAAVVTVRDLVCVPPPHEALQAVHALQTDNWQLTAVASQHVEASHAPSHNTPLPLLTVLVWQVV